MAPFAKWPPRVNSVTKLDVVREERGLKYSRDQGTSFRFLGEWYYFFGDTFCFNPQGQYIPDVVCNNIAKISDVTKPALCRYDELDSTGKCYMFIPFIDDEIKVSNARCILWVFGGVVEVEPCVGFAWAEKCILHNDTGVTEYCGTVLAQIGLDSKTGRLCATRLQGTIFGSQEPRIGTLCNIVDGDYVYLFGPTVVTILARVAKGSVAVRGAYEFWNGKTWVKEYQSGAVLFQDMQQGHVFRSKLFGPSRPWVFIGSNKWMDGKVIIGAAPSLTGPWEMYQGPVCQGVDYTSPAMYCHYPHPWGNDEKNGKVLITYCEHYPGNVIAATLNLEMNKS